jgi:large subunit ribosomal protein L24
MERKFNKQQKLHIKTGDLVEVIAGNSKGKKGKITKIDAEKQRAFVEGVNMNTKHIKPAANNPQGEIVKIEGSIHISNLMVVNPQTGKPARTKRVKNETTGKLERVFKEHTAHKNKEA